MRCPKGYDCSSGCEKIRELEKSEKRWMWIAAHKTGLKPSDGFDREWVPVERPVEVQILTAIYDDAEDRNRYTQEFPMGEQ